MNKNKIITFKRKITRDRHKSPRPGMLVWATIDDLPPWPGRIAHEAFTTYFREKEGKKTGYAVLFFSSSLSYGLVDSKDIVKFDPAKADLSQYDPDSHEDLKIGLKMAENSNDIVDPPYISQFMA